MGRVHAMASAEQIFQGLAEQQRILAEQHRGLTEQMTELTRNVARMAGQEHGDQGNAAQIPTFDSWVYREKLDGKKMSVIEKFGGGEAEYKDWSRSFKGAIRVQSGKLARLMEVAERIEDMEGKTLVTMMELDQGEEGESYLGWEKVSAELHDWLDKRGRRERS